MSRVVLNYLLSSGARSCRIGQTYPSFWGVHDMPSLWGPGRMWIGDRLCAVRSAHTDRTVRRDGVLLSFSLGAALLLVALAGCGTPVQVPLAGPGLNRTVAQGGLNALHFWWLPPTAQNPAPRLLLWDGASVGLSDPAASNQSFTPLKDGTTCNQVALAPDNHAFACGQIGEQSGGVVLQSLVDVDDEAQHLLDESAPLAWAPDSQWLAALRLGYVGTDAVCSVVAVNTSLPDQGEQTEQVLLDSIPFVAVGSKTVNACPVMAMAWSPDGSRLALSLASPSGVVLEVLAMSAPGQPATIESRHLLPGQPLQMLDTPGVSSLFWSSDGQMLAALSGYGAASEDGLFLLALGQQDVLTGPNLVDSGDGAALAWSPDARWLAVGAVGAHKRGDNAQLRVFDAQQLRWQTLAPMFVSGDTVAWSADSSLLAAASVSQQGEVIWNWPSASLSVIIPNQESSSMEQLGWAPDGSALFFTLGSHSSGAPFYDDVYAQRFPVPPGVSSFAFPAWFLDALEVLPQALIWFGGALLVLIALALLMVLVERGRSRRRRSFIFWALGVGVALFGLLLVGYSRLPGLVAGLYQPSSAHLCQGAPHPCNPGAALSLGALGGPLALGLLVMVVGTLVTSRKPRFVPGEGLPRPVSRGPLRRPPAEPEEAPLLLPPPIDQQDTLELEIPPVVVRKRLSHERDVFDQ